MIVLYDASGKPHPLADCEDYCITHMLDGCDTLSFCLDVRHEQYKLLYEEARVVANGNEWLIKKIDDDKIDCELNFDFLKGTVYTGYQSKTLPLIAVLEKHLPEDWKIVGGSVSGISRTIEFDYCTDFDVVYQCMNTYGVYFVWQIADKTLTVYSQKYMQPTGEYLTSELNLKSLSFKGDTTEFATRLYAFGKDGMTMAEALVDGKPYGLTYVENKDYVNKTVCAYWSDERYTVPENLYEAAVEKLSELSVPIRSYECSVVDLAKQNDAYSFLDFKMHKKVTLIDTERGIRVEHQIVEYKEYPDEPDRNVVTLSCVPPNIKSALTNAISTLAETNEKMKTSYDVRVAMATAMLTGAFGGYAYSDGAEFFILDNEDPAKAMTVWRWNINGFGKSSTGIDGPYTTAMTFDDNFVTGVVTAMVIRGAYIEAGSIKTEALSQEYRQTVTDEITGEVAEVRQEFTVANGELRSEISRKVDETEFGTKIVQNYQSVQISWNNISKYISFSDGALKIYESTNQGDDDLLMQLNHSGAWYYHSGYTIGKIGTNNWTGDSSFRGLVFDLESDAGYMCWAHRENPSDSGYIVRLIYYADDRKAHQGVHFECPTYCWSNLYINENVRTINFNSYEGGLYSESGTVGLYGGGAWFKCGSDFEFGNSANLLVNCYDNIDLHGYDILNQCDARLKTNIAPTETGALDKLSQIELQSFDWIETGQHCDVGIIAQQLQEILPDLVAESPDTGRLSVRMVKLIPYLIKAVQELQDAVAAISGSQVAKPKKKKVAAWKDRYSREEKAAFTVENSQFTKQEKTEVHREPIKIPIRNRRDMK